MKNTKTFKLLVAVLSLMLLIGSVVAVSISAEENDETYSIEYINISHNDAIVVLIAVDAPVAEAENIEVKYTIGNGEEKIAKYWGVETIKEVEYPTFYTVGVPMKDMGETIKAEAHKVGTTPAAPEYADVSVANYLYQRLYKDGYVTATEGEDLGRKNLYKNLLSYGAQAQKVLWNNKHPEAIRPLVTDIVPVYVEGDATVAGEKGLVKLDGEGYLDLAYTGTDLLTGWKVTNEKGTNIYYNNVYVTEGAKVSPVTVTGAAAYGFEDNYTETIDAVANDASGNPTYANVLTFDSGVTVKYGRYASPNAGNAKATVKTENGNKYINIYAPIRANNERSHGISGGDIWTTESITNDANVYVLSFDYRANSTLNGTFQFVFRHKSGYTQLNTSGATLGTVNLAPKTGWNNVRFEYYSAEHVLQIYVNDTYAGNYESGHTLEDKSGTAFNDMPAVLTSMEVGLFNSYAVVDVDMDNIATYKTTKTYVAFPYTPLNSGTVYDFESETAGVIGTNPDFTNYTFTGTPLYVKNNGSTHECSAGAEIIEENGNKFFYMYGGKRVDTANDRGWSFNNPSAAEKLVPDNFANLGVLELDMKIDNLLYVDGANQGSGNAMINWSFYFGSKYVRFDPTVSGTDIKLAGYTFMTFNTWYTVRLEFNAGDNTINVYSKLKGADDWTRSFVIPADATPYTGTSMENISAGAFRGFDITGGNGNQMYSLSFDNVSCYSTRK